MCGIYGFLGKNGRPVDMDLIYALALDAETRGGHAFGFAWVDAFGRIRMYKQPGLAAGYPGVFDLMTGAKAVIGHARFATAGRPADNANNHPHHANDGYIVHNGVIRNYRELVARHDLHPVTDCDSEVIGLLMEEQGQQPLLERAAAALGEIYPYTVAGLWLAGKMPTLVLSRTGTSPCFVSYTKGSMYFCSLDCTLPGKAKELAADRAWVFQAKGEEIYSRAVPVSTRPEAKVVWAPAPSGLARRPVMKMGFENVATAGIGKAYTGRSVPADWPQYE